MLEFKLNHGGRLAVFEELGNLGVAELITTGPTVSHEIAVTVENNAPKIVGATINFVGLCFNGTVTPLWHETTYDELVHDIGAYIDETFTKDEKVPGIEAED